MITLSRVKDLFELPEHLSKSAFVLKLAEGVEGREREAAVITNAPRLTRADIRGKLEELLRAKRQHYLFALHGTGEPDVLRIDGAPAEMPVIPVRSELDLRRRLVELGEVSCATFLVPWEGSLPMDLQGRFARDGYVFRVGRETRILALFGAVEIEPEVRASPLVSYLLQYETERFPGGGRLTVDRLWQSWLERACRLPVGQELALDVLLGWAASDGGGPAWVELLARRGADAVRLALHEHLANRLGLAGQLAWRCWERGEGAAALEMAVLAAAVASANGDPAVATWWQLTLPQVLDDRSAVDASARLAEASEPALRAYEKRAGIPAVRKLVEAADARIQIEALRPALVGSTRLPSAWRTRLDRLGEALVAAAEDPGRKAAAEAVVRLRALAGHVLYADDDQRQTMERAEMAVRLASWLALRPDRAIERSPTPYTEVECLSAWYAAEGGYVDWARRWARGGGSGGLFRGIGAVLAAVDRERTELDRTFAAGLPHYLEARRPADLCIPIDQALERIAGRFLKERSERRLLVLLMDGMAWAQAVEIVVAAVGLAHLHRLAGEQCAPADLGQRREAGEHRRIHAVADPVVPDPVPRDRPPGAGLVAEPGKDPDRWKANKIAVAYSDPGAGPRLLLRGEGQTKDGAATSEALSLVEDRRRRIVAVVIAEGASPESSEAFGKAVDGLLERRLADVSKTQPQFAAVLRACYAARLREDHATEQGLISWLMGQPNVAASVKAQAQIKGDLDSDGASGFLRGLLEIDAPSTVAAFLQRMGRTGRRSGTVPNCTFLATDDLGLLRASALVRLFRKGFVESVRVPTKAAHLLAHQLMALTIQEDGGVPVADWWSWVSSATPFSGLTETDRAELVAHMLAEDILFESAGRYSLGARGEKLYGWRNFSELYAVFSTPQTLRVMFGAQEIGSIDALFAQGEPQGTFSFILGAKAWRAVEVNWKESIVRVEPIASAALARWQGPPQLLGWDLCQAIRDVLTSDTLDAEWSQRARSKLAELRAAHGLLADDGHALVADGHGLRLWTFAGGRANNLLGRVLEAKLGLKVVIDNQYIAFREQAGLSDAAIRIALTELREEQRPNHDDALRFAESCARRRTSKFQPCLSDRLESELLAEVLTNEDEARRALSAPE